MVRIVNGTLPDLTSTVITNGLVGPVGTRIMRLSDYAAPIKSPAHFLAPLWGPPTN